METLSFSPIDPVEVSHQPKVRAVKFGDGYEQRTAAGLNSDPQMWSLIADKRLGEDVGAVYDFLKARGGHEAFFWTPPGETVTRVFVCRGWKKTLEHYSGEAIVNGRKTIQTLTFQLEEVFET